MTTSGPVPEELETIAAFIDQRLSPEERLAFIERLDEDEALYEVFVETVRCRDEASDVPAEVIRHPSTWRAWALPAAAAAVVLVAVGVGIGLVGRGERSYGEMLAAGGRLAGRLEPGWYEQDWPRLRGGAATVPGADVAFHLGVMATDLEVALLTGRRGDALVLTRRLETLSARLGIVGLPEAAYASLAAALEVEETEAGLLDLAHAADRLVSRALSEREPAYRLGEWAEAGRLAAATGGGGLLEDPSYRARLRRLRDRAWPPEVAGLLARLDGELRERPADPRALEKSFSALISTRR